MLRSVTMIKVLNVMDSVPLSTCCYYYCDYYYYHALSIKIVLSSIVYTCGFFFYSWTARVHPLVITPHWIHYYNDIVRMYLP